MTTTFSNAQILHELEPEAERLFNRHMSKFKEWNPHDFIPWSDGKNYYSMGGEDWSPEQVHLTDVARVAMVQNLLTEDNLPSYHREIAMNFSLDSAWGQWVNRWTAEETRHSIALRDYLVVTRAVDPIELERFRIEQLSRGFSPGQNHQVRDDLFAESLFDSVCYVSFQELATRVAHRNTGKEADESVADKLMAQLAHDENLHMLFYRDITAAGLEVAPDQAMRSIYRVLANFTMPGFTVPEFRRRAVLIAIGGIYDPNIHLNEVVLPVLRKWRIFERDDFTGEAARYREELAKLISDLEAECVKFNDSKQRYLAREARRKEKITADGVLVAS